MPSDVGAYGRNSIKNKRRVDDAIVCRRNKQSFFNRCSRCVVATGNGGTLVPNQMVQISLNMTSHLLLGCVNSHIPGEKSIAMINTLSSLADVTTSTIERV